MVSLSGVTTALLTAEAVGDAAAVAEGDVCAADADGVAEDVVVAVLHPKRDSRVTALMSNAMIFFMCSIPFNSEKALLIFLRCM